MRNKFGEQLERLHVEMIQIGALCEDAISAAAKALMTGDQALAQMATDAEREIDEKEREVESLCLKLLLQQQPVAGDLREISAALKMISDLERIGDHSVNIMKTLKNMHENNLHFSDKANKELDILIKAVNETMDLTFSGLIEKDMTAAFMVEPLTEVIKGLRKTLMDKK